MRLVEERGTGVTIVTASAGNHGRAIAWAAEQLGIKAIVFTPRTAAETKTRAIVAHGADLRAVAANYEEAERLAQQHARDTGHAFVSPYSDRDVIAGAGTIGLELLEQVPDLQAVLVPIGGGGLISGVATAIKGLDARIEVIGVEVEASSAFAAARAAGHIVEIDVGTTIADGLGGNVDPDTITWPFMRDLVDRILVVPEPALREAVRTLLAEDHLVAEGAGVAAIAAVASRLAGIEGRRAAALLTGANIDLARLTALLDGAEPASLTSCGGRDGRSSTRLGRLRAGCASRSMTTWATSSDASFQSVPLVLPPRENSVATEPGIT